MGCSGILEGVYCPCSEINLKWFPLTNNRVSGILVMFSRFRSALDASENSGLKK